MKKLLYSLMALVLPAMGASLASCDNDESLPNVDLSLEVSGGTISDGTIYVAQGDTLNVDAVNVMNNEAGKGAAVTNVSYYLNNIFLGRTFMAPFGIDNVITENVPAGDYVLSMSCTVLAVDKSIAVGAVAYPVKVVPADQPLPAGSNTVVVTMKADK